MELEGISTVDLYTKIILNIRLRHYKNISKKNDDKKRF